MIRPIRLRPEATEAVLVKLIGEQLHDIYSNKSSEEYKMCGDIAKSPTYEKIEIGVSELKTLKGFSKNDAKDMETMFMTLHRPIFKKMVAEYIAKPEDRNIVFTSVFTVGYRLLVSELSRIIASTEASNKGIVYKPDKASRHQAMTKFIRYMNSSIETSIDEELKKVKAQNKNNESTVQEAFNPMSVVNDFIHGVQVMNNIFHTFINCNNPLSTISSLINLKIENNVKAYDDAVATYESTKEAYNEYLRTPESQRKKSILKKYEKMMNKYNMEVNRLKAQIAHYDQRANSKTEDDINKTIDDLNNTKKSSTKSTSSNDNNTQSNDDNDFDF